MLMTDLHEDRLEGSEVKLRLAVGENQVDLVLSGRKAQVVVIVTGKTVIWAGDCCTLILLEIFIILRLFTS